MRLNLAQLLNLVDKLNLSKYNRAHGTTNLSKPIYARCRSSTALSCGKRARNQRVPQATKANYHSRKSCFNRTAGGWEDRTFGLVHANRNPGWLALGKY